MKTYKPDITALKFLKRIIILLGTLITVASRYYFTANMVTFIIFVAMVTIVIYTDYIYLPLYFKSLSYEVDKKTIVRHGGVIFRTHKSVHFSSIQYIAIVTTPYSVKTSINFIVFFLYGGRMHLDFLSNKDCEEIRSLALQGKEKADDLP